MSDESDDSGAMRKLLNEDLEHVDSSLPKNELRVSEDIDCKLRRRHNLDAHSSLSSPMTREGIRVERRLDADVEEQLGRSASKPRSPPSLEPRHPGEAICKVVGTTQSFEQHDDGTGYQKKPLMLGARGQKLEDFGWRSNFLVNATKKMNQGTERNIPTLPDTLRTNEQPPELLFRGGKTRERVIMEQTRGHADATSNGSMNHAARSSNVDTLLNHDQSKKHLHNEVYLSGSKLLPSGRDQVQTSIPRKGQSWSRRGKRKNAPDFVYYNRRSYTPTASSFQQAWKFSDTTCESREMPIEFPYHSSTAYYDRVQEMPSASRHQWHERDWRSSNASTELSSCTARPTNASSEIPFATTSCRSHRSVAAPRDIALKAEKALNSASFLLSPNRKENAASAATALREPTYASASHNMPRYPLLDSYPMSDNKRYGATFYPRRLNYDQGLMSQGVVGWGYTPQCNPNHRVPRTSTHSSVHSTTGREHAVQTAGNGIPFISLMSKVTTSSTSNSTPSRPRNSRMGSCETPMKQTTDRKLPAKTLLEDFQSPLLSSRKVTEARFVAQGRKTSSRKEHSPGLYEGYDLGESSLAHFHANQQCKLLSPEAGTPIDRSLDVSDPKSFFSGYASVSRRLPTSRNTIIGDLCQPANCADSSPTPTFYSFYSLEAPNTGSTFGGYGMTPPNKPASESIGAIAPEASASLLASPSLNLGVHLNTSDVSQPEEDQSTKDSEVSNTTKCETSELESTTSRIVTEEKRPKKKRKKRIRPKCTVPGCENRVVQGGVCISHGAKRKLCSFEGCTKGVKSAGRCSAHGPPRKRCFVEGCKKVAVQGGRCISHGGKKKSCRIEGCSKVGMMKGMCKRHHDKHYAPSVGKKDAVAETPTSMGETFSEEDGNDIGDDTVAETPEEVISNEEAFSEGDGNEIKDLDCVKIEAI